MNRLLAAAFTLALVHAAMAGHDERPTFEVASVKLAPNGPVVGCRGGPGSADPGHYTCAGSLYMVLTHVFKARTWELSAPEWLNDVRIEINAKMPEGATREQISPMLLNLLVDRFKLTFHREKREMAVYELMFVRMGPNLKEVAGTVDPPPQTAPGQPATLDGDGFPIIPGGDGWRVANGRGRIQFRRQTMYTFAYLLAAQIGGRPVLDATGLGDNHYALTLSWYIDPPPGSAAEFDSGPNIFKALQDQLGLKLESKKAPIEVTVIDHMERSPTEN
jgi:uncharacterized protein (TIGR03435 family)